jgi:hypothetical protein
MGSRLCFGQRFSGGFLFGDVFHGVQHFRIFPAMPALTAGTTRLGVLSHRSGHVKLYSWFAEKLHFSADGSDTTYWNLISIVKKHCM